MSAPANPFAQFAAQPAPAQAPAPVETAPAPAPVASPAQQMPPAGANPFGAMPAPAQPAPAPAPNPFGAMPTVTATVQAAPAPFAAGGFVPAPAQPAPVDPNNPFATPDAPVSAATQPRLLDLRGRLVIVRPTSIERNVPSTSKPGETYTRVHADITVLDGGPLYYGGAPEKLDGAPHDKAAQVPYSMSDVYLTGKIGGQVESKVGQRVLARVVATQLPTGTISVTLDPAVTPADVQVGMAYLQSVQPFSPQG